jgi:hypothetical protein
VPPKTVDKVVEAETTPLMAWRLPVKVPTVKPLVKRFVEVALVVVPLATLKLVMVEEEKTMMPPPPLGVTSELVEVAHFEFGVLVSVTQALRPTKPAVMVKQPSAKESTRNWEVEATPLTVRAVEEAKEVTRRVSERLVPVALVLVEFTMLKLVMVEEALLTTRDNFFLSFWNYNVINTPCCT